MTRVVARANGSMYPVVFGLINKDGKVHDTVTLYRDVSIGEGVDDCIKRMKAELDVKTMKGNFTIISCLEAPKERINRRAMNGLEVVAA